MGCFLGCFGSSNDKKRRRRGTNRVPSGAPDQGKGYDSVKQVVYPGESLETVQRAVSRDKIEPIEQAGCLNERKWESPAGLISVSQNRDEGVDELRDGSYEPGKEEGYTAKGDLASPSGLDSRNVEKFAEKLDFEGKNKVIFDPVVVTHEPPENCELLDEDLGGHGKTGSFVKSSESKSLSEAGSANFSSVSYPFNHRYQNCRESDDEEDDLDYEESVMDVGDGESEDDGYRDGDDLSGSACSVESTSRLSSGDGISPEVNCQRKKVEATDYIPCGDDYDQPMLNPVENLLQWKALKARRKRPLLSQHKNSVLDRQEIPSGSYISEHNVNQAASIKSKAAHQEQQTQPMAVDASLSNWLPTPKPKACKNIVPQQTMADGSFSPKYLEDRPILGALTVEELMLMSTTSSSRSSPTKSPDDMTIIGSAGSCWSIQETGKDAGSVSSYKGIPNTTSKYREDKRVNWHSTPFETRLEKALSRGSARA